MTDKERLEIIKMDNERHHQEVVFSSQVLSDIKWLIEQAGRVQELENHIDHLYDNNVHLKGDYRLQEQNKRYREALEAIRSMFPMRGGTSYDKLSQIRKIAEKALEGEE